MAAAWARVFDPNSMVTLRKAAVRFDVEAELAKIRAKVLYERIGDVGTLARARNEVKCVAVRR
jgi:hypothetical protein